MGLCFEFQNEALASTKALDFKARPKMKAKAEACQVCVPGIGGRRRGVSVSVSRAEHVVDRCVLLTCDDRLS